MTLSTSNSNASTANNDGNASNATTKATKATQSGHGLAMTAFRSLVSRFTAHGPKPKPITIHCHETCNGCESTIIASDHGPYIKCLDYGYSNRKRNKHDPDTLYRDVDAFLHEASQQGGLPETPEYLSQCSFIEYDSEASARENVSRRDGVLKGDCWYPGPAPAGWTSSQSTPKTTQQAS